MRSGILFYLGWFILPILLELIPAVGNFFILYFKNKKLKKQKKNQDLYFYPNVSIIIPVYNSAVTLKNCIRSVAESDYDISKIDVFCIDNGSKDDSFNIFQNAQMEYSDLAMNWMYSAQGKSNALNKAIYNCEGKYIINIDSDGQLEKKAIKNMIKKFENNPDISCMTGAVLTDPFLIKKTSKKQKMLKIFQNIEFMEYCQAFLAGRNFQSEQNEIFTISGAFSAVRKSILFKTRMYNTETICEDAHLTFQIKENLHKKVALCEDAIFMVDPIESIGKYYVQRQRWQIGELEVAKMFVLKKMKNPFNIFFDSTIRNIIIDHTMSFPKFIWFFVILILIISRKTWDVLILSNIFMYLISVFIAFLYYWNVVLYLQDFPEIKNQYKNKILYIFLLPIYMFYSYIVRFCGIINSINRKSSWKTKTFFEEKEDIKTTIKNDLSFIFKKKEKNILKNDIIIGVFERIDLDTCNSDTDVKTI